MLENLSPIEKIDAADKMLEILADSKGRERCAQICVLGDLIDLLRKDVLVIQEQLKDKEDIPEITIEIPEDSNKAEEA